ncbi:MAG TPA: outer membrane beta-barrel protein [Gemmatimonadales bacterium]|nr:outer membrane beta-barrel protein [Gemmatimonadales bacterium]
MKRVSMAVLAAAGLVAVAIPAAAQTRLNIGASVVNPMSDWGTADKMGFGANLGATLGLGTAPVHLRIEGSYEQTSHDAGVDGNTKVMGGMANLVYPFQAKGNIKPYIIGGLGYNSTKVTTSGVSESKGAVGFGGGLGFNVALSSANLYIEGRYLTHKANSVNFSQVPVTVGLTFPVGGSK